MKATHIILTGLIMLLLDTIYLSTFSGFYNNLIKSIQGKKIQFKISGAVLCYLFLIFGLCYFILDKRRPIKDAFLLGIVIYSVYETTNYATLDNWTMQAVLLDTFWGGSLFALTTAIMYRYFY
jgi:uncharacterized membrane protein